MTPLSFKTNKKMGPDFKRQKELIRMVGSCLKPGDVVVYEDFSGGRWQPSGKFIERIELLGMMKLVFQRKTGLPYLVCRPNHIKMFVANKASASKDEVKVAVKNLWGCPVKNQDEADAAALAMVGAALVNGNVDLKGKREKAVNSVLDYNGNHACLKAIKFLNS
jgi:hypothetical protein